MLICDCPFGIVRGCSPHGALSIAHLPGHENIPYDYPHFLVWNQTVKQPHSQDIRMLSIRYWNYLVLLFSALSFICARMAVRYAFRHAFFRRLPLREPIHGLIPCQSPLFVVRMEYTRFRQSDSSSHSIRTAHSSARTHSEICPYGLPCIGAVSLSNLEVYA